MDETYPDDQEQLPPVEDIDPALWPSDGPAVIAGVEEVSQDPDLFADLEQVELP